MAGKIHRYEVLENSALLPGIGEFPEPDFWSNDKPIMAVCEPQLRAGRNQGDWIFHVPKKGETSGPPYQVTGILKVEEQLNAKEIIEGDEFNDEWVNRFKLNLAECGHLIEDLLDGTDPKITTAKQRVQNHLIGNPSESIWFGATGTDIRDVADDIGIELGSFAGPQIAELTDTEADRLAEELASRFEDEAGTPPNAVF